MSQSFENPYEPAMPSGPSPVDADSTVMGPAIGLIVSGIFWVLFALYGLFNGVFAMFFMSSEMMRQNAVNQRQLDDLAAQGMDMDTIMKMGGAFWLVVGVIGIIFAIVIILGGVKMMKLKSRGLVYVASILAMLPCSCGCLVGLPIGIWSLVVLNKPEISSAFR